MLKRVRIKNWRSLADVDVELGPFNVLVGLNGSGKSNFGQALAFLAEAVLNGVDSSFETFGGAMSNRPKQGRGDLGFHLDFFPDLKYGTCSIRIRYPHDSTDDRGNSIEVMEETYTLPNDKTFIRKQGSVRFNGHREPLSLPNHQLALRMFEDDDLKMLASWFSKIRYYSVSPEAMRPFRTPGSSSREFSSNGSNSAAVLRAIAERNPDLYRELCQYLQLILKDLKSVSTKIIKDEVEYLSFKLMSGDFSAFQVSDGTLRSLGILLSIYQPSRPGILIVEEPESTVHPAALHVLMEALWLASQEMQVLIITHSPDVLDYTYVKPEHILTARMKEGRTLIEHLDEPTLEILRRDLDTPGGLQRIDELSPYEED